jgi:hypothetical protein
MKIYFDTKLAACSRYRVRSSAEEQAEIFVVFVIPVESLPLISLPVSIHGHHHSSVDSVVE